MFMLSCVYVAQLYVRRDLSTFQDYGNLNQGRYAHACGSYLTSSPPDMVPVSSSFMLYKLCIHIF